ncbi:MAG TPA: replication-relaxation family protein [Thermoanaerobaculia bacterium]|nr:replication-relaxation family protein [Thermoanaerobaculia bacterium]
MREGRARFLDRPRSQIEDLLRSPGSRPMAYALRRQGAALLRVKLPKPVKLSFVEHALSVSEILTAFVLSCRKRGDVQVIPFREILEEKAPAETRRKKVPDAWQVKIPGEGPVGVSPDAIFGLHFLSKPEKGNRADFFLEVDRGTMPVMRTHLQETSMWRKLVAYYQTAAAGYRPALRHEDIPGSHGDQEPGEAAACFLGGGGEQAPRPSGDLSIC